MQRTGAEGDVQPAGDRSEVDRAAGIEESRGPRTRRSEHKITSGICIETGARIKRAESDIARCIDIYRSANGDDPRSRHIACGRIEDQIADQRAIVERYRRTAQRGGEIVGVDCCVDRHRPGRDGGNRVCGIDSRDIDIATGSEENTVIDRLRDTRDQDIAARIDIRPVEPATASRCIVYRINADHIPGRSQAEVAVSVLDPHEVEIRARIHRHRIGRIDQPGEGNIACGRGRAERAIHACRVKNDRLAVQHGITAICGRDVRNRRHGAGCNRHIVECSQLVHISGTACIDHDGIVRVDRAGQSHIRARSERHALIAERIRADLERGTASDAAASIGCDRPGRAHCSEIDIASSVEIDLASRHDVASECDAACCGIGCEPAIDIARAGGNGRAGDRRIAACSRRHARNIDRRGRRNRHIVESDQLLGIDQATGIDHDVVMRVDIAGERHVTSGIEAHALIAERVGADLERGVTRDVPACIDLDSGTGRQDGKVDIAICVEIDRSAGGHVTAQGHITCRRICGKTARDIAGTDIYDRRSDARIAAHSGGNPGDVRDCTGGYGDIVESDQLLGIDQATGIDHDVVMRVDIAGERHVTSGIEAHALIAERVGADLERGVTRDVPACIDLDSGTGRQDGKVDIAICVEIDRSAGGHVTAQGHITCRRICGKTARDIAGTDIYDRRSDARIAAHSGGNSGDVRDCASGYGDIVEGNQLLGVNRRTCVELDAVMAVDHTGHCHVADSREDHSFIAQRIGPAFFAATEYQVAS